MTGDKPWPQVPVGNKDHTKAAVVIVGAGVSGLCMAIDLVKRNNCRNFIILEKSAGLGGTWHDNKYPGCACDVWSSLYSYSFAQNSDWTREYPGQEEILAYLIKTAQEYNLYQHIRFNSTVEDAVWDDKAKKWETRVTTAKGSKDAEFNPEYVITSDFLVSAVGQLNQPKWPDVKGLDNFEGKKMHSARWDWSYDLTDKKIALLGNGCTAVQILPEIQKVAKHITMFQRTPNWVIPRMDAPISPLMQNLYRYLPPLRWRKRAVQMDFRESSHSAIVNPGSDLAVFFKNMSTDLMKAQLPNQPELWEKLTPKYNIGCKRIIISDDFFPAIDQSNVTLETRPIHSIEGHAVKVNDPNGTVVDAESDYDLLVCATGFQTTEFLHPIQLTGKNGRTLSDVWKNGAKAYLGTGVEAMPNFAMFYGPNTNLGHNSIILMIEAQSRYINGLIGPILAAKRAGKTLSLSPHPAKVEAYNAKIQSILQASSFNDPSCQSWYKNEAGLITNNWSGTVVEYQDMMATVHFDDYVVEGSAAESVKTKNMVRVGRVVEETRVSDRMLAVVGVVSTAALVGGWVLRNSRYMNSILAR
ncbi:Hypothetical protein R9X50_00585800 [Acrodontium crateriforme]|uniref:Flavin-binding monooxygenase n=1 Tax=Acrodontium crateriforme TaxID=150365 RepID=A0AAQ3RB97_9PEZI|nr:Hypothetical protein R9X50_00585800 [Acrodontium crateriforme]